MHHRGGSQGRGQHRRGQRRHIRRFLEPCLLLLLHRSKSHGYELAQNLAPFGLGEIDPSLVYRMLRDMESSGLVESAWDPEVTAGPARRVYHVTRAGQRCLAGWVKDLGETDRFLHHFLDAHEREGGLPRNDKR